MKYFELFEIPVKLNVNAAGLRKKYIELSRRFHPDYFVKSSEEEKAESLENSSVLNKAYKTFLDPDETIRYVLKEKNLLEEEEKYELPPEFLMEVLEINESLMEDEIEKGQVESRITELQNEIYAPVKTIIEDYVEGITPEEGLLRVKEYYYKKKYLDRIIRQLNGMA